MKMNDLCKRTLRDYIDKQDRIFAKTYVKRTPHEYIVRGKLNGKDDEYMTIICYTHKKGITMYFWNYPNKYIFVGG